MTTAHPLHRVNAVAVHLALLKTGKAAMFSGSHEEISNWNKGESSIWDPQNPDASCDPHLERNLFCSGHCQLPDGRLFVAGGQSTFNDVPSIILSFLGLLPLALKITGKEAADHDLHTFDPTTEKWTYQGKMHRARWYPTCVTLPDGKALIVSGTWAHAYHAVFGGFINLDYEIFDPLTNTISAPKKFVNRMDMYPFLQVLPGGMLFVHSEDRTTFWDIATQKMLPGVEFHNKSHGTRTYPGMGSCVLLPLEPNADKAKILAVGGSTELKPSNRTPATNVAEIFTADLGDIASSPGWEKVFPNPLQRFLCDSVLLPDGTVLVTNGAKMGVADDNKEEVMEIELFNPVSNSFSVVDRLEKPRLYHSSAVLLPDGRVVVAGSTGHIWLHASFSPDRHFEHIVEVVTPPYLAGNPDRPSITSSPSIVSYNSSFEVTTEEPSDIRTVSLVRLSSTTHNNNMDQRCIMLDKQDIGSGRLRLTSPKDGTWAPPGHYILFIVNNAGVPSIGKVVKVG